MSASQELFAILVLAWIAFAAAPLSLGAMALSWDALNHHFYLGWTADSPRFDRDVLAAAYQGYQFPYLYWPVYKLAMANASGPLAGTVLALIDVLAVPPVWLVARSCIPGRGWFEVAMRAIAVGLAFCTAVVASLFTTTANDLVAAIPVLWAIAFGLATASNRVENQNPMRMVLASGLLAGIGVAFKLSNGPLVLLVPILWALSGRTTLQRVQLVLAGGLASAIGFTVTYGYWGWELWAHFGNPFFPFFDPWFDPVRNLFGWRA